MNESVGPELVLDTESEDEEEDAEAEETEEILADYVPPERVLKHVLPWIN